MRFLRSVTITAVTLPMLYVSPFVIMPQQYQGHGRFHAATATHQNHRLSFRTDRPFGSQQEKEKKERTSGMHIRIPACVECAVLKQVYPALIQWQEQYGHSNIPLGTPEGRMCQTLRRLETQQKLNTEEVTLLNDMGFRFQTLEDVYHELDFDEMYMKLISYEQQERNNYQVPKKYAPDPELGAWVTGIRRVKVQEQVDPVHQDRLDAIGFSWISERKCGSKFMKQFRELTTQLGISCDDDNNSMHRAGKSIDVTSRREDILQQDRVQLWIAAQREARRRGALSDTRFHYMQQLLGDDWMETK